MTERKQSKAKQNKKQKTYPFPKAVRIECEQLHINLREIITTAHMDNLLCLLIRRPLRKFTLTPDDIRDIQTLKDDLNLTYRNLNWLPPTSSPFSQTALL